MKKKPITVVKIFHLKDTEPDSDSFEDIHVLYGTIDNIREFAKDRWSGCNMAEEMEEDGEDARFKNEKEYFKYIENDYKMLEFLQDRWGYEAEEIARVTKKDFK